MCPCSALLCVCYRAELLVQSVLACTDRAFRPSSSCSCKKLRMHTFLELCLPRPQIRRPSPRSKATTLRKAKSFCLCAVTTLCANTSNTTQQRSPEQQAVALSFPTTSVNTGTTRLFGTPPCDKQQSPWHTSIRSNALASFISYGSSSHNAGRITCPPVPVNTLAGSRHKRSRPQTSDTPSAPASTCMSCNRYNACTKHMSNC